MASTTAANEVLPTTIKSMSLPFRMAEVANDPKIQATSISLPSTESAFRILATVPTVFDRSAWSSANTCESRFAWK